MHLSNAVLLVLNLPLVGLFIDILRIPYARLFPLILVLCVLGVNAIDQSVIEVWIMAIMGAARYVLRSLEFETAPIVPGSSSRTPRGRPSSGGADGARGSGSRRTSMRERCVVVACLMAAFGAEAHAAEPARLTCEQLYAVMETVVQYRDQGYSLQQVLNALKGSDIEARLGAADVQVLRKSATAVYLGNASAEEVALACRQALTGK